MLCKSQARPSKPGVAGRSLALIPYLRYVILFILIKLLEGLRKDTCIIKIAGFNLGNRTQTYLAAKKPVIRLTLFLATPRSINSKSRAC